MPPITLGPLTLTPQSTTLRIHFRGTEVVRQIDVPIRDADWRTLAVVPAVWEVTEEPGRCLLRRPVVTEDGSFTGTLAAIAEADDEAARLDVALVLKADRPATVNRAGFVLLHPIAGVAGMPLTVTHPDGSHEITRFPDLISPSQPVFDIAGLAHEVSGTAVEVTMTGEVFEMEDQRNWTDASFKTYCRPLGRPRPYAVAAGETIRQSLGFRFNRTKGVASPAPARQAQATAPEIVLAHDDTLGGVVPAAIATLDLAGIAARADGTLPVVPLAGLPLTLEIVVDPDTDLTAFAALAPARVVALPRSYLASHQPDGPWPVGPTPGDLVAAARAAFPEAEIGGGMLTNFTEVNRCRPQPADIDFLTFGTTAIVHAADDRSVLETLDALPDVLASATALAGGKPLRLGLMAIGMRSNPYGTAVAPNSDRARIAMARDDPRQSTGFASAWAVAVAALVARAGVASYAPAMTAGPIGLGVDGGLWPLFHTVAALAALGGGVVTIEGGGSSGLVRIAGQGRRGVIGLVANLGPGLETITGSRLRTVEDSADPLWLDGQEGGATTLTLAPFSVAVDTRP